MAGSKGKTPPSSIPSFYPSVPTHQGEEMHVGGAIVVFAKCPTPGASKTRLAPLLGDDGAASLARAMLKDILVKLSDCVSLTCFCAVMNKMNALKLYLQCILLTGRT